MQVGATQQAATQSLTTEQQRVRDASLSFERLLVEQMLQSMERTLDGGLMGSRSTSSDYFEGIYNQALSREICGSNGMGLAQSLYEEVTGSQWLELGSEAQQTPVSRRTGDILPGWLDRVQREQMTRAGVTRPDALRESELRVMARDTASAAGLDPDWVEALVECESAWDSNACSRKGAMGLMQLMPATAQELGVQDPWDAQQNLEGGVRYLATLLNEFEGDRVLAAAAYNAGPAAVKRYEGVPPYAETEQYVQRIERKLQGE